MTRCPHCDLPWPKKAPRTHTEALAYMGLIHPPELQVDEAGKPRAAINQAKPKAEPDDPCDVCAQVDANANA